MTYIYVIAGEDKSRVKIGISDNPAERVNQLQTGNAENLELYFSEEVDTRRKAELLERKIHDTLRVQRVKGEWFSIDIDTAIQEVQYHYIRWNDELG